MDLLCSAIWQTSEYWLLVDQRIKTTSLASSSALTNHLVGSLLEQDSTRIYSAHSLTEQGAIHYKLDGS